MCAVYDYSGENWNDEKSQSGDADLFDGKIIIMKCCLEEPEIHAKIEKTPTHKKKLVTKRITHMTDVHKHLEDGNIVIEKKCKNEFCRFSFSEIDYIAYRLLLKIFEEYQVNGELPETTAFIQ